MKIQLRPHQHKLKSQIYHEINHGNRRVMVRGATGIGKTFLAASIAHDAVQKGLRVCFSVPTLTLVDQTFEEFCKCGLEVGIIQGDNYHTDYSKPVQICSIQTIASKLKRNNKAEMFQMREYFKDVLFIQDEAHQRFDAAKWMNEHTSKPVIGLSATPWSKGLGNMYDTLINGPSVSWLIDNGFLSNYKAFSHYVPDMKGVKVNASGDYSLKESGEKYDKKIIGDIVNTWKKHAKGRQTILFAPRVIDAHRFCAEFCAAGISATAVDGRMDNFDCRHEVDRFRSHEVTVICSVAKLTTGFDVTDVGCIIDAQPTRSLMRHVQKLGRGLRTAKGKDHVVIHDHAGNLLRLGLPDGDFPEDMDDGSNTELKDRKDPEDPLPKACSKCGFMKEPKVHICPNCGFAPEKQSTLEVEAGDLVELTKTQRKHNRDLSKQEKAEFYGGLKQYAADKGFKSGWASHKYKSKLGVWPNAFKNAPMCAPNALVLGHIKHENIKNAHRRST